MCIENFFYADEDDRLAESDGITVFIHIVFLLWFGDFTYKNEKPPEQIMTPYVKIRNNTTKYRASIKLASKMVNNEAKQGDIKIKTAQAQGTQSLRVILPIQG